MKRTSAWAGLALLGLIVGLPWLPRWLAQPGLLVWGNAVYSDLLISHWPLSTFVHDSLFKYGQLPLWNPLVNAGQPLIGDPLAGLSYPIYWLTYLLPRLSTFHLLLWAHQLFTATAMFALARDRGHGRAAAAGAAIAWGLTPRLLGQWGLGHVTLVFAVAWTPAVLWAAQRAARHLDETGLAGLRYPALAGALIGAVFAIDPRWAPAAGLLALALVTDGLLRRVRSQRVRPMAVTRAGLAAGLASLGAAAVLAAPMLNWLGQSTRWRVAAEASVGALPLAGLIQVFAPDASVWPEWSASLGATVFVLLVVGLVRGRPSSRLWGVFLIAGWLFSLGAEIPLKGGPGGPLAGLSLLRVPARWLFVSALAAAMLVAEALDGVLERASMERLRLAAVTAAALSLFGWLGLAWISGGASLFRNPLSLISAAAALAAAAAVLLTAKPGSPGWLRGTILLLLLTVEGVLLSAGTVEMRDQPPPRAPAALVSDWGQFRVFDPTHALSEPTAAARLIERINGVSPLQLERSWQYLASAVGFDPEPYSVTTPPYPSGDPALPEMAGLDLQALRLLNTRYLLLPSAPHGPGLRQVETFNGLAVYQVLDSRPRAWIEPIGSQPSQSWMQAPVVWTPNRLQISANGPGRLVVSEISTPGWHASVDGVPGELTMAQDLLRAIDLDSGEHVVVLTYSAPLARLGALASLLTWLALAALWFWR